MNVSQKYQAPPALSMTTLSQGTLSKNKIDHTDHAAAS